MTLTSSGSAGSTKRIVRGGGRPGGRGGRCVRKLVGSQWRRNRGCGAEHSPLPSLDNVCVIADSVQGGKVGKTISFSLFHNCTHTFPFWLYLQSSGRFVRINACADLECTQRRWCWCRCCTCRRTAACTAWFARRCTAAGLNKKVWKGEHDDDGGGELRSNFRGIVKRRERRWVCWRRGSWQPWGVYDCYWGGADGDSVRSCVCASPNFLKLKLK